MTKRVERVKKRVGREDRYRALVVPVPNPLGPLSNRVRREQHKAIVKSRHAAAPAGSILLLTEEESEQREKDGVIPVSLHYVI